MDALEIRAHLIALKDENYGAFHRKLCPGLENIIGIRMPQIRTYAKEIYKSGGYMSYLNAPLLDYAEEKMLFGYVLALPKLSLQARLPYIKTYVNSIDSWAVCDSPTMSFKFIQKDRDAFFPVIESCLASGREYVVRFAVVALLAHYINDDYIDSVLSIIENIRHDGYYVKMAAAWALSVCYVKYPDKTEAFILKDHLDDFTHNKAIQKICESFRVDKDTKERLKGFKRKKQGCPS